MQHSRAITQKSASNLALAFILLPQPKRDAMSALTTFAASRRAEIRLAEGQPDEAVIASARWLA